MPRFDAYDDVSSFNDDDLFLIDRPPFTGDSVKNITGANVKNSATPDATFTTSGKVKQTVYNVKDYGAVGDGATDDKTAIRNAGIAANAAGGGIVFLPSGTYYSTGAFIPYPNVIYMGQGIGATTIKCGINSGSIFTNYSTADLDKGGFIGMTFDLMGVSAAGGVFLYNVTNSTFRDLYFKNANTTFSGWMLHIGVRAGLTDGILNRNNTYENITFDTHGGSLEMFLIYNAKFEYFDNLHFRNKSSGGPCFNMWQKVYDSNAGSISAEDCLGVPLLISTISENITVDKLTQKNTGGSKVGVFSSDYGTFGIARAKNIKINSFNASGGANSSSTTSMTVGAVDGFYLGEPTVTGYEEAIVFLLGDTGYGPINWTIDNPTLYNNNPTANVYPLHVGILFQTGGGDHHGRIIGGQMYDDQATITQRYPICFYGTGTYDYIDIEDVRLSADTVNSATSIVLQNSAVLGSNVRIINNKDYSGTNPAQLSTGDVVGPSSATDNAVARYDGTTGKLLQDSSLVVSDTGGAALTSATAAILNLIKTGSGAGTGQIYNDTNLSIIGPGSGPNRRILFLDQLMSLAGATNTAGSPVFGNFNDTNTGIFFPSNSDEVGISTGAVERLRADANGNISIGTAAAGTSKLQVGGPIATAYVAKTANYTVTATDSKLSGDCTSGNLTFTLPAAASITGREYHFKRIDASGNSVIIDGNASETIDGATTKTITTQWGELTIYSNGTNWLIKNQMGTIT